MAGNNTAESPHAAYTGGGRAYPALELPDSLTQWSNKHNACVSEEFVATITSKSQKCDKDGGNGSSPCPATIQR